ncbi:unnamed protein product [Gadus morhua 'NCC']
MHEKQKLSGFRKPSQQSHPYAVQTEPSPMTPQQKAELLQDQYVKVFSNPDAVNITECLANVQPELEEDVELDDFEFTEEDLISALKELDPYSATPDALPTTGAKDCIDMAENLNQFYCRFEKLDQTQEREKLMEELTARSQQQHPSEPCHCTEAEMDAQELRDPASGKQEPVTARKRKWKHRSYVTQPPASKSLKPHGSGNGRPDAT